MSETAKTSADGGEVRQLLVTALRQYQHNDCSGLLAGYDCAEVKRIVSDLIAEHSRIVVAKDAEIARLSEVLYRERIDEDEQRRKLEAAEENITGLRAELSTQPARQVGGDEREQFGQWFCEEFKKLAPAAGVAMHLIKEVYWAGWKARAALAPAAVVMPERKDVTPAAQDDDWPEVVSRRMAQAHNAALDEVARLNRCAIPAGLLERVCLPRNEATGWAASADAINELRALLNKEGDN